MFYQDNKFLIEYEQAMENFRFYQQLRMTALQYAFAIHGALLVAFGYLITVVEQQEVTLVLPVFAIVITFYFHGHEKRAVKIADTFLLQLFELEKKLNFSHITHVDKFMDKSTASQEEFVSYFYLSLMFLWFFIFCIELKLLLI